MRAHLLADYLARPPAAFSWAGNCCGDFVGRWVRIATGRDPLSGVDRPRTAAGWARLARDSGGMAALVSSCLGASVNAARAQTGDIVLFPGDIVGALGICTGRHAAVIEPSGAIALVPMAGATHAWPLGAGT